jgi:hypothetical protein
MIKKLRKKCDKRRNRDDERKEKRKSNNSETRAMEGGVVTRMGRVIKCGQINNNNGKTKKMMTTTTMRSLEATACKQS